MSHARLDGLSARVESQRRLRGHDFWPAPTVLDTVPALYVTDGVPAADKTVLLHYFAGGHDWYIVELDPASGEAFGFVTSGDCPDGELGYIDMSELEHLCVERRVRNLADGSPAATLQVIVERDLDWTPTRLGQIAPRLDEQRRPVATPTAPALASAVPAPAAPANAVAAMDRGLELW